ncbi:MAG: esterase-like activity of phytase family protein [Caulobacter sp.]|nr:esterase-like activity of phytase family protein [Caulobacter sp.]
MTAPACRARILAKLAGAFGGLAMLASCAAPAPVLPPEPQPAGPGVQLVVSPVALDDSNPGRTSVDGFTYAGGLAISDPITNRVHGLSDIRVTEDGRLLAISDLGDRFEATLSFDADHRLVGLTDGKVWPLTRPDGQPVQGKREGDAEGLAVLASGDRLVSFERDHRIWLYPADGGPPRVAPKPDNLFSENEGMEALTEYPSAGPDAYVVGSEEGESWLCHLASRCERFVNFNGPDLAFGLTAFAAFPDGSLVVVHRAFDPIQGARILVSIYGAASLKTKAPQPLARMTLQGSLTRDNIEGVALVTSPTGGTRLLLMSDDNASSTQRTLLLAFDWTPRR